MTKKKTAKKAAPKKAKRKATKKKAAKKLTPHRERFCQAYNIDPNAAKAYFKVYKCSKATAETNGPGLLRFTQVKARIKQLQSKVEAKKKTENAIDYSKPLKNNKHERFSQEYVVKLVVADAYKQAYPKASQSTAEQNGSKLLKNIKVVGRIFHLQAKLSEACGVTAEMLMDELKKIGFSNIDDYLRIDDEGNVIGKDFGQMDSRKLAAIESIKQVINITSNKDGDREYETRNFQFKLHDKLGAIEKMGKHIGFYLEDNAQKGKSLVTIITAKPMSDEECENIREILKRNAD